MNNENFQYHKMGAIIRKHRTEKGLKLLDLAGITGIKSSMLSKIENGRMVPTIPTLFSIIYKLGISADAFFAEFVSQNEFAGYVFLPKNKFTPYQKEEDAIGFNYFSILETGTTGGAFQVSLLQLQSKCSRPVVTTAAFEFIMVLSGKIKYQLEDSFFAMEEGDALFFDGSIPHVPHNESGEPVSLLVLYLFSEINNGN